MTFHYRAFTKEGKEVSGVLEATSQASALQLLEDQAFLPIEIGLDDQKRKPWYSRDLQLFSSNLSDADLANLSRHLSTLILAGLPSTDSLEIAKLAQSKKKIAVALQLAQSRLLEGQSISDAFGYPGNPFSSEFRTFLYIGDASNSLGTTLKEAANYFATRATTRDKVTSALIYPAILMLAGIGLILVLTLFLVPTLLPLFQSAGVNPPIFFRAVDRMGAFTGTYWPVMLTTLIAVPTALGVWVTTENGKAHWQGFLYRLPKIGPMLFQAQLEQVCRGIAMLVKSGFTLPAAFTQIAKSTQSHSLTNTLNAVSTDLHAGETAASSLKGKTHFPKDFHAIVDLAERTNRWPEVLSGYADALNQRNEETRNRLLTLITPIITITVGLLAGGMIYAVMGALLEINEIATF